MPDVRVGIVSWNTAELLERCLAALPAALGDLDAEVVVVDNASSDSSAAVAAAAPGVRLVANATNVGYAAAMDVALGHSDAPVLLALNPDTEPGPGTLARVVRGLDAHPDAGVVVPRLVGAHGEPQHSANRFPTALPSLAAAVSVGPLRRGAIGRRLLLDGSGPHAGGPVPWAIAAVAAIRAAALQGEPPFATRSFMYAEDLELCWRLAQRGWTTYLLADVEVLHVGNAAGEQAWGDQRSVRFWAATYDVVALRRSSAAARRLGLAATVACLVATARAGGRALVGSAPSRHAARAAGRRSLREARLHWSVVRHGPPPPPTSPPTGSAPAT
jgi:N-acetylglucosaminyl-diphospho-decaprenol L-rhamnosyltransferase